MRHRLMLTGAAAQLLAVAGYLIARGLIGSRTSAEIFKAAGEGQAAAIRAATGRRPGAAQADVDQRVEAAISRGLAPKRPPAADPRPHLPERPPFGHGLRRRIYSQERWDRYIERLAT